MMKTVAIGVQDFEKIRENQLFYIDKTAFIREWWSSRDTVTGIKKQIVRVFSSFPEIMSYDGFDRNEKAALDKISEEMNDTDAAYSINLFVRTCNNDRDHKSKQGIDIFGSEQSFGHHDYLSALCDGLWFYRGRSVLLRSSLQKIIITKVRKSWQKSSAASFQRTFV